MGGSGFGRWLASRTDAELASLLRARPDLCVPAPRSTAVLAARAGLPGSVARAIEALDAFTLQVLAAVALAPGPVHRDQVLRTFTAGAAPVSPAQVIAALDRLRALAVVFGPDESLRPTPGLAQALPYPAGLGRPGAELARDWIGGPEAQRRLAELGPPERDLLASLVWGPTPVGLARGVLQPHRLPAGPLRTLLEQRLLVATGVDTVELPREVGLALRGDTPLGPPAGAPPQVPVEAVGTHSADQAGAAVAREVLHAVEALLESWGAAPPTALKSGGLGVRELRALARALDRSEAGTALLAEVAHGAGLADEDIQAGTFAPTAGFDQWRSRPPEQRWAILAAAWLDLPRLPSLAGQRDDRDKPIAALSPGTVNLAVRDLRRQVLVALAELEPGSAADADAVEARLAWSAPLRAGPARRNLVAMVLEEAGALGVTGRGALTSAGRALLHGGAEPAGAALAPRLPAPVDHVLLQADLTAVAPGPLRDDLAAELAVLAEVESSGAATVFRFSEATIRRALDSGRDAAGLHAFLAGVSSTPVPQGLSYLVDDVARRHGQLRAGTAGSYLRCEDPALLDSVVAERRAQPLALRRVAPTVAVSPAGVGRVLEVLRSAGYAPVAESAGGATVVARRTTRRVPLRARWTGSEPMAFTDKQLSALVARLRTGDAEATPVPPPPPRRGLMAVPPPPEEHRGSGAQEHGCGPGTHAPARTAPAHQGSVPAGPDDSRAGATHSDAGTGTGTGTGTAELVDALRLLLAERARVRLRYLDRTGQLQTTVVQPEALGEGRLLAFDESTGHLHWFPLHRVTDAAPARGR